MSRARLSPLVFALACACRPAVHPQPPTPPPALSSPAPTIAPVPVPPPQVSPSGAPIIRVGLTTEARRASIGADSGVVVRPVPTLPGQEIRLPRASFAPLQAGGPAARFRIQVASVADEAQARSLADRARERAGASPAVRWNEATKTFQVRVGEFPTRDDARVLAQKLGPDFPGAFVVQDSEPAASGRLRLLETGAEFSAVSVEAAREGEILDLDAVPYRGSLEVRVGDAGALTIVDVLDLEEYLRGVVPNELSPAAFPEIEALKAQAVAARTYALRNLGKFAAQGYDICATPTCQVYKGRGTEHELTDRAVAETRGTVARYGDALVDALYTSTCGGHTEQGDNIFVDGERHPYLAGVPCAAERNAWYTLRSRASLAGMPAEEGLPRAAALLEALDVAGVSGATGLDRRATAAELREWLRQLPAALRRRGCGPPVGDVSLRGRFFAGLVGTLCWEERARRLLAPGDADYLLRVEDGGSLDGPERAAAAILLQEGVLAPDPTNRLRPEAPITRAEALALLGRAVVRAGAPGLIGGEFSRLGAGALEVRRGDRTETLPMAPDARLFRVIEGRALPASELTLVTGDRIRYVSRAGTVVYLEVDQSLMGASADKTSRYYRWEVRLTPEEVARGAARYGTVGTVKDVAVRRLGVSGRVVELAILGSDGDLLLKGLKIRWALGLRENLFVVDRERDAQGQVERFVFTGKGWGHGVGLCQVGAFGLAQSGSSFEQILKHYYSGIRLDRAY